MLCNKKIYALLFLLLQSAAYSCEECREKKAHWLTAVTHWPKFVQNRVKVILAKQERADIWEILEDREERASLCEILKNGQGCADFIQERADLWKKLQKSLECADLLERLKKLNQYIKRLEDQSTYGKNKEHSNNCICLKCMKIYIGRILRAKL